MIEIKAIRTRKEMEQFIGFPNILYKGDPYYVPALYKFEKKLFDRKKNSFFRHAEVEFFLACDGKEIRGRVAAILNQDHIAYSGEQEGFFGFFESVDDAGTARGMLEAAGKWLKERGMLKMTGPENFSTNEVCGILTEGFNDPPVFMLPYNKPYYASLLEKCGLAKVMDLSSYKVIPTDASRYLERLAVQSEKRLLSSGIIFRPISFKQFDHDIALMHEAYNQAFSNNWGFVPLTGEDFSQSASQLRQICDPQTILMALKGEKCIGFIVNVPDVNQVLIHIMNGKLFPFGFIHLKGANRKISRYRILIIGTIPEYRHKGVDLCLIAKTFQVTQNLGTPEGEAAYVMDDNRPMKDILARLQAVPVKKYGLYRKIF